MDRFSILNGLHLFTGPFFKMVYDYTGGPIDSRGLGSRVYVNVRYATDYVHLLQI